MATVLALSLYFIFAGRIKEGFPKMLLLFVCVFWPLMIAFTRVYLNVHWFSDVIGSLSLGIFWVTFSTMIYPLYSIRK